MILNTPPASVVTRFFLYGTLSAVTDHLFLSTTGEKRETPNHLLLSFLMGGMGGIGLLNQLKWYRALEQTGSSLLHRGNLRQAAIIFSQLGMVEGGLFGGLNSLVGTNSKEAETPNEKGLRILTASLFGAISGGLLSPLLRIAGRIPLNATQAPHPALASTSHSRVTHEVGPPQCLMAGEAVPSTDTVRRIKELTPHFFETIDAEGIRQFEQDLGFILDHPKLKTSFLAEQLRFARESVLHRHDPVLYIDNSGMGTWDLDSLVNFPDRSFPLSIGFSASCPDLLVGNIKAYALNGERAVMTLHMRLTASRMARWLVENEPLFLTYTRGDGGNFDRFPTIAVQKLFKEMASERHASLLVFSSWRNNMREEATKILTDAGFPPETVVYTWGAIFEDVYKLNAVKDPRAIRSVRHWVSRVEAPWRYHRELVRCWEDFIRSRKAATGLSRREFMTTRLKEAAAAEGLYFPDELYY